MKKRVFILLVTLLAVAPNAFAYSFSAVAPSGQTLYYNAVSGHATVVHPGTGSSYDNYVSYVSGDLVIPDSVYYQGCFFSVSSIGNAAFYNCSGLTSVTIPNSVTSVGGGAFYGCSGLTSPVYSNTLFVYMPTSYSGSYTIPSGITTICGHAFYGCTALTSVIIPNSVTSIADYAFNGCSGLTSVNIGSGVTSIGNNAFYNCIGLISMIIADNNTVYDSRDNCNAIIETSTNKLIMGFQSTIIPNSIASIGSCAFNNCGGLTAVTIPNSVISIGNRAFSGCGDLTSVVFNARNCSYVGYLDSGAFYGCDNITNFTFGDSVEIIPNYLCYGLSGVTSDIILNNVTSIGNNAFSGCSSITSITIGNSATSIGENAFRGCDHLTNITLGSSLQSIGNAAFYQCTQVVRIKSYAPIAPTVQSNTFYGLSDNVILNVPCGYGTVYENAAYWHRFDIQEDLLYTFSAISGDPSRGTVQIIHSPTCDNAEAEIQANPYHGFHFVRWSDGDTHIHRYLVVVQDTAIQAEFAEGSGTEGIDDLKADEPKVYSIDGRIVVEGATDKVRVYDMMGRLVRNESFPTGVYLVKIGNLPARRVVVLK